MCPFYVLLEGTDYRIQVMREMGFSYDPSTAGSSVRFDPPSSKDKVSTITVSNTVLSQFLDVVNNHSQA